MNREEFLRQLEELLYDIPENERRDAPWRLARCILSEKSENCFASKCLHSFE